jgi:hypothetical protein
MNTLLDQSVNQELARKYRANMREKSNIIRLLQKQDPAEKPVPRRKSFRQVVKPRIAYGIAIVTLTLILIAQNVAIAIGGGGGGGGHHLVM